MVLTFWHYSLVEEIAINQLITKKLMKMQLDEHVKDMVCSDMRTYQGNLKWLRIRI